MLSNKPSCLVIADSHIHCGFESHSQMFLLNFQMCGPELHEKSGKTHIFSPLCELKPALQRIRHVNANKFLFLRSNIVHFQVKCNWAGWLFLITQYIFSPACSHKSGRMSVFPELNLSPFNSAKRSLTVFIPLLLLWLTSEQCQPLNFQWVLLVNSWNLLLQSPVAMVTLQHFTWTCMYLHGTANPVGLCLRSTCVAADLRCSHLFQARPTVLFILRSYNFHELDEWGAPLHIREGFLFLLPALSTVLTGSHRRKAANLTNWQELLHGETKPPQDAAGSTLL